MTQIGGFMEKIIENILKGEKYIEKRYKKGDNILTPLDKNSSFFIVISGSCTVTNQDISGEMISVFKHREGSFFGESEIILPEKEPLLVVANEDCRIAIFSESWFIDKIKNDFEFTFFLLKNLAEGRFNSTDKRTVLRFHTIKERYFIAIKNAYESGNLQALTKKELAEQVDAPIRSLNRIVSQCYDIIEYKNKKFEVINEELFFEEIDEIM